MDLGRAELLDLRLPKHDMEGASLEDYRKTQAMFSFHVCSQSGPLQLFRRLQKTRKLFPSRKGTS